MNAPFQTGIERLEGMEAMLARWNGDGESYDTVEAYWRNPAPFTAREALERDAINARFDAHHARNHLRCEVNEALETMVLEMMA